MTKVKIFSGTYPDIIETRINEFIETHNVTNIKYQTNGESYRRTTYSAMIVYEEG